jgi:hypothetical protein
MSVNAENKYLILFIIITFDALALGIIIKKIKKENNIIQTKESLHEEVFHH